MRMGAGRRLGAGLDRKTRRIRLVGGLVILGCGLAAVAVGMIDGSKLSDALIGFLMTVPGLYLTLASFRDDRLAVAGAQQQADLAWLVEQLAGAVRLQWEEERQARQLRDPYALPVRWVPADPSLVDSWPTMLRLAGGGSGWPVPPAAGWVPGPDELAGSGTGLADLIARVPTGRVVVLGEPGSGKTVLALRLVLDLLERRAERDVVPVLVSAASWDPAAEGLFDWLAGQLAIGYPGLVPSADRATAARVFRVMLDRKMIMPVVDGLDEIRAAALEHAVAGINDALAPGHRIVVTSRRKEFLAAISHPDGTRGPLRGAAGIELCPLDTDAVDDYLHADAVDRDHRWEAVLSGLPAGAPLRAVLSSPLFLALARTVYHPRPDEFTGTRPDPRELRGLPDQDTIEDALLSGFVTHAYRDVARAGQVTRWLGFIAAYLESARGGPDLAWWEMPAMMGRRATVVATGLVTGVAAALSVGVSCLTFAALGQIAPTVRLGPGAAVSPALVAAAGALLAFVVCGLAGGALAGVLYGAGHRRVRTLRRRVLLLAGIAAVTGSLTAYTAWPYERHWAALAIGTGAATVVATVGGRLLRKRRDEDLRRAYAAAGVVGAMTWMVFLVAFTVHIGSPVQGLIWARVWLVIIVLCAFVGASRRSGTCDWPAIGARWRWDRGTAGALLAGAAALLVSAQFDRQQVTLSRPVVFGAIFALAGGIIFGMERVPVDQDPAAGPAGVLARDKRASIRLAAMISLSAAVFIGTCNVAWLLSYDPRPIGKSIGLHLSGGVAAGAATVIVVAVGFGITALGAAWPRWLITCGWLSLHGRLPLHPMAFLNDAHQRGVLRQSGPYYQFRHIALQHHLAGRLVQPPATGRP